MTRRTTYKVVEGSREQPVRILVKVSGNSGRYARATLPGCLVGKIVEVTIPVDAGAAEVSFGNGGEPAPITNRKVKAEVVVAEQEAVAKAEPVIEESEVPEQEGQQ